MDLREAGIGEGGSTPVGPPRRGGIARLRVGREIEDIGVAAGAEDDGIAEPGLDFSGDQMASHDSPGLAVDHDEVEHFGTGMHLDRSGVNLPLEGGIGTEKELLPGLTAGVEGPGDLGSAEGTVIQHSAVLAGEGDALGHALVDDVETHLGEAVNICLARAEIAPLDRVVEEAKDAVAVVPVILGCVDSPLCSDAVSSPWGVVEDEALDLVAELPERRGSGSAGQARAHHQDLELPFVIRSDQFEVEFRLAPLLFDRTAGNFRIEFHLLRDS